MMWQEIASAPKDGTRIMLYFPKWDIAVSGFWGEIPGESDGPHVYYEAYDEWITDNDTIIIDDPDCAPTHWYYFPDLPKAEGQA